MYRVLVVDDEPHVLGVLQAAPRMVGSSNADRDVVEAACNEVQSVRHIVKPRNDDDLREAVANGRQAPFG